MGIDFSFGIVEDKKAELKFYSDSNKYVYFRLYLLSALIEKREWGKLIRKFLKKKYSFDFYYKSFEEFGEREKCGKYPKDACVFNPPIVLEELEAIKEVLNTHNEEFVYYKLEDKGGIVHVRDMFYKGEKVHFSTGVNHCEMIFDSSEIILFKDKYVRINDYKKGLDIRKWKTFTCQTKSENNSHMVDVVVNVTTKPYIEVVSNYLDPLISVCKSAIQNKLMVLSQIK